MTRRNPAYALFLTLVCVGSSRAEELRVPGGHPTIQAALDRAKPGDVVRVAPGSYAERVRVGPGVTLLGDDATTTILDGGGDAGKTPGVTLAEGSRLDGFTITRVGTFDEALWKKHHASRGEELGDDEGAAHAEGTVPAVAIREAGAVVRNCVVTLNGDVGIAVVGRGKTPALVENNVVRRNLGGGIGLAEGADAIVRSNRCSENLRAGIGCRKAHPTIENNVCFENVRAGIGIREGATPLVRGNVCERNRRAGIGVRMADTAPFVRDNQCRENGLAGIGTRDQASPVLRDNLCERNRLAGIGCDGASPIVVGNVVKANEAAGIGVTGKSRALLTGNRCVDNALVAIGVVDGASAVLIDNELSRTGGKPPLLAVKAGSEAVVRGGTFAGGGVAAALVEGKASFANVAFVGAAKGQGQAIWAKAGAELTVTACSFVGYRSAVDATGASVSLRRNRITGFERAALIVRDASEPPTIVGNVATSSDAKAQVLDLRGREGYVADNLVKAP